MSRSLLSVLTAITASSAIYFLSQYLMILPTGTLIPKDKLISILTSLRKKMFSTLRQIAFITMHLHQTEHINLKSLVLQNGSTSEMKLNEIQKVVLGDYNINKDQFQYSYQYWVQNDVQIKMLANKLQKDIELALDGIVGEYHGPLPEVSPAKTLSIYKQIIERKMSIIEDKMVKGYPNRKCLKNEFLIQEYLESEGISHQHESNEKIFLSLLEKHYKQSSEFKVHLQLLKEEIQKQIRDIKSRVKK